jgi:hypothetical protein
MASGCRFLPPPGRHGQGLTDANVMRAVSERAYAPSVVVTGLIVLGAIVFVAIDGYVLYRVFAGRRRADDYGAFSVPGHAQLMLQPGKVKVSYQEAYRAPATSETGIDFGVPSGLHVTITSPDGKQLAIKRPGFHGYGESIDLGRNWSRALVGTVEVAQAGEHTITAEPELEGAREPRILIGR